MIEVLLKKRFRLISKTKIWAGCECKLNDLRPISNTFNQIFPCYWYLQNNSQNFHKLHALKEENFLSIDTKHL